MTNQDNQCYIYLCAAKQRIEYYTQYIKKRDDWEFVKVYTDESICDTSTKRREGFNEMVVDAIAGNDNVLQ